MGSFLVYKFSSARCASAYVEMTACNFNIRVAEHRGMSYRTGQLQLRLHSAVRTHAEQCNVPLLETQVGYKVFIENVLMETLLLAVISRGT
jgi:hypothetical protein